MKTGLERIGLIILVAIIAVIAFVLQAGPRPTETPDIIETPATMPDSMLSYTDCMDSNNEPIACASNTAVPCYSGLAYQHYKRQQAERHGATVILQAALDTDETLEIYQTDQNGGFVALVVGKDNAGDIEACEVARGRDLRRPAPEETTVPDVTPAESLIMPLGVDPATLPPPRAPTLELTPDATTPSAAPAAEILPETAE